MQLVLELAGVLFFKSSKFAHADAQRNSHTAQRRPPTMGGKPPRQHTSLLVTGLALSVALVAYVSLPEDDAPPRVVALSEEATCENKDERPSEMSWDVLQRSALSSAMSWGFEYFKNNYVPTEYKEELAKQAFAQTVIREDNARQAARRAKRKGGTRE